jgi:hypothetical protein
VWPVKAWASLEMWAVTVSESWLEYWPGPVSRAGALGLGEPGRCDVICLLFESSSRSDGQLVWVGGGRVELGEPVGNAHHGLELSGGEHGSQPSATNKVTHSRVSGFQPVSAIRPARTASSTPRLRTSAW